MLELLKPKKHRAKNIVKDARGIFLPIGNTGYTYPCIGRRRYWEPAVSFPLVEGHNL